VPAGRYSANFTKKCPCGAEHLLFLYQRKWAKLTIDHFDADGTTWLAIFHDSPPVTTILIPCGGGTEEWRSFDEIVKPSRFIEMIAVA